MAPVTIGQNPAQSGLPSKCPIKHTLESTLDCFRKMVGQFSEFRANGKTLKQLQMTPTNP